MLPIDKAWVRDYLVTYGHSFLAETGLTNPDDYYARELANQFDMAYPTGPGGSNLKRAIGGSGTESAVQQMLTEQPWIPDKRHGSNKVLLIQALINTARKYGVDPVARQGAEHALRTMVALGSSLEVIPDHATTFQYAGVWQPVSDAGFHGGAYRYTQDTESYVTFAVPVDGTHFLTAARKSSLSTGSVIQFRRLDTGQVFKTWNNLNQASPDGSRPYVPAAIPLRVPSGTVVRAELVSGVSLVVDGLIVPASRPGPILLMKEPYLADYSLSTMFPNGSDEALDYYNGILDTLAGEFPNVIVADPNTGGYWDKSVDILQDGVHPNAQGHYSLFLTLRDAIRDTLTWKSFEAGLYL